MLVLAQSLREERDHYFSRKQNVMTSLFSKNAGHTLNPFP